MAITRTTMADGSWTEKADTPESAKELYEKHKPEMQKKGAEDFHRSYMKDLSIGAETLVGPGGKVEAVRADQVEASLASGYSPMNKPRTTVPALPWPKKETTPGKHRYRYNRETGNMEEV